MFAANSDRVRTLRRSCHLLALLALMLALPLHLSAGPKNKKATDDKPPENFLDKMDISKIVWPQPPAIARVKYTTYFSGEKLDLSTLKPGAKKKQTWMDRLAGAQTEKEMRDEHPHFVLIEPYGMAANSKGELFVADEKVGAIFVFNPETKDVNMIKNGIHANFGRIIGLAIDDGDRIFVSDAKMRRVLVFNPKYEVVGQINTELSDPSGLAIDNENRVLYVADVGLDQVLAFDADTLTLIRKIGSTGHNHELTSPGDFSKPVGVAVDSDGNLYVADTMNNRIEIFDADGLFIKEFGKEGDGPGYFARPKGVALDSDDHIWVADGMQDRVQVFNKEGRLLTYLGGHGNLPGQFAALCGIAMDKKNNRVFTSEQYPGRVQEFRYVTEAEAAAEKARREAELKGKHAGNTGAAIETQAAKQETAAKAKDSAPQ
jgi:DNA-binding beta-propeller fold protein YncE